MRQTSFLSSTLLLAALIGTSPVADATKLYKWTDENGRVHYSDRVPPEAAAREREVKSGRGETLDRVEAAKTREQLEAERIAREQEEARRRAAQEAAQRQAAADRTLLLTFSSARDIERARDDRVSAVNGQIALTRERLEKLQGQLDGARQQAADAERTGRGDPGELHKRVQELERQIADYEAFIEERRQERASIITRFNADLARYQELMDRRAQQQQAR